MSNLESTKRLARLSVLTLALAACGGPSPSGPVVNPPVVVPTPTPPATPAIVFTTVETIAGQVGVRGSVDGKGSQATFNYPAGLAATGAKNGEALLYIAGLTENIRYAQVGHADNPVGTAIGKGQSGSVDGDAATAEVRAPQGIAVGTVTRSMRPMPTGPRMTAAWSAS